MSDLDKILARLASLKDLAERTDSAGEAAAAVAGIQRLLFTYNLTMADVPDKGDEYVDEGFHVQGDPNASQQRWKGKLLGAVASVNFCRIVVGGNCYDNAHVIGRPANVRAVIDMFQYLEANAKRQCLQAWKRYEPFDWEGRSRFNRSFYSVYVVIVANRLQEQRKESVQETANGSALVVQLDREVAAALDRFYPNVREWRKSSRPNYCASPEGFLAGYAAGENVNLDKQVRAEKQLALSR